MFNTVEDMAPTAGLGELELMVLLALLRLGPDAYGVPIAREIEAKRQRSVALGSVYAALERLEGRGLAVSELGDATPERGGKAKRHFRITAAGLRETRAAQRALVRMWQGIPALEGGHG